jgi:hypothetical protein
MRVTHDGQSRWQRSSDVATRRCEPLHDRDETIDFSQVL